MNIETEITEIKKLLFALADKIPSDETSAEEYGSFLIRWFNNYKCPKNTVNTSRDMLSYIDNRIIPALGNIPLNKLSGDDIQSMLVGINKSNTRNKIALIINGSLTKAYKLHLIKYNPFDSVELNAHRNKHYRALTIEEQNIMYSYLKNKLYKAVYYILICTGMRIGEFLAVDDASVDMINRTVNVYHTVDIHSGELQDRTKTYTSMRAIPFLPELTPYLKYIDNYILKNGRLSYNQVKQYFKKAYIRNGLTGLNLHSCRHTFGCMCYRVGISEKMLQHLMGHSSLDVTMNVYVDVLGPGNSVFTNYFKKYKNDVENRPTDFWRILALKNGMS